MPVHKSAIKTRVRPRVSRNARVIGLVFTEELTLKRPPYGWARTGGRQRGRNDSPGGRPERYGSRRLGGFLENTLGARVARDWYPTHKLRHPKNIYRGKSARARAG